MTTDADARTARPQDDLYRHVNGTWLATHEIPADRGRDGVFHALHDQAQIDVRTIIEDAARVPADDPDADEAALIATLYGSFMDTDRVEELGREPLRADLELLERSGDLVSLARAMGALQRTGVGGALGPYVDNDADAVTEYRLYLTQSGLGLPDESYYRKPEHAQVLGSYREHVARMLVLAGVVDDDGAAAADRVIDVETRLAAGHWDQVRSRDAQLTYNPTSRDEATELLVGFDVVGWLTALAGTDAGLDALVVRQPDYLTAFAQVWTGSDVAALRTWLTWHLVHDRAPFLADAFVQENFAFYGRTLTGAQQVRERWKRGVSFVEGVVGEAIGKLYVSRHFPPSHKEAMDVLVADLTEAYRRSISALGWMSEPTRERALAKLEAFTPKVGYPTRWRDFSGLRAHAGDLLGNVRAASVFETDYQLGKLQRELDREEWLMPPQMVNAYYNPGMNEIVFPAAILQPPFFDAAADAAANYGAIGAVIGHEIGHGFDDQGSRYDGEGRLQDWWTAADRAEFDQRAAALIAQYDALSPAQLDGSHTVNGAFTVGENIGDVGGLGIAIKAYRVALEREGREPGVEDLQALFTSWARAWRLKGRDEEVIRLLSIDPHSPDEFRCNQVVKNLDEFHAAFGTSAGDGMWLDPEDRVVIW